MITFVTKANGSKEQFNADKINKVVEWACEGYENVSASEIAMNAKISLYEGVPTEDIHDTLIKSAGDLISEENPDYQYPAGRLLMLKLRKQAYGTHTPPHLMEHVEEMVSLGWYSQEILDFYNEEDFNKFDKLIDHELDFDFPYIAARAFQDKYLVADKKNGTVLETPQTAYILVAMMLHCNETENRDMHIENFYKAVSGGELSLPTPIIAGVRTPVKQYSSCVLIEAGDTTHQIFNANTAQAFYSAQRAGIGVNLGMIRGSGSSIRGGSSIHSGVVPIAKMFQESLNWISQGGVRKGSANYFYPVWHYDYENIVVLKNNRGTEETRARHVDCTIQVNELMYERLVKGGNITFFDPNVADGLLYKYFFESNDKFKALYESLEKNPNVRKKSMPALEAWKMLVTERSQTGRIYLMNVDTVNERGSFDQNQVLVKQSNLCVAPETKILTDRGYEVVSSLEGEHVNVWNGEEFSDVVVIKTGENQKLIKVSVSDGKYLECTPYHKFYIEKDGEIIKVDAETLKAGDKLIKFKLPEDRDTLYSYEVVGVEDTGRIDDTYCFNEPKRHMGVFNGILTGQCVEITLPTEPMNNIYEGDGLVSTCTLAAINLGKVKKHEDIQRVAHIAVRALDNLIGYQEYPVKAAEKGKDWRNLGIGVINFAYYLAENMAPYGSGYAKNLTHQLFEDIQFCLINASVDLAKEKGVAKEYSKTKYSKGLLPIDWYKKEVDEVHTATLKQDWEWLREQVKEFGMRNCTLSAIMPSESSSQVNNATNGIEPPRSVLSYKSSKAGTIPQVIPESERLKPFYTFKWDMEDCLGYLETCAIIQKFTDQSISTNTTYKPHEFPNSKLPAELVLKHMFYARRLGIKTLYYHETEDGNSQDNSVELPSEVVVDTGCESGACNI